MVLFRSRFYNILTREWNIYSGEKAHLPVYNKRYYSDYDGRSRGLFVDMLCASAVPIVRYVLEKHELVLRGQIFTWPVLREKTNKESKPLDYPGLTRIRKLFRRSS